ncbi:MAG: YcaO-like family protein, partial [Rhodospirillales bacterium]|nr:YcaO-like family protein [Rhodospirillales bacterium]
AALMESVESYHAERISLPLKIGSYEELRYTHEVINVGELPRLSGSGFSENASLLWIEGQDLLNDRNVWVPYELVHLNYTVPLPPGHGFFVASSNGLDSGNHVIEAMSHAVSEVIERDAVTLWHLLDKDQQDLTRVDETTIDDPVCRHLLDMFEDADVGVGIWDITSDVRIPAFLCRLVQRGEIQQQTIRPASGMGCHPCREIALSRALTEAAQSRLTFVSGVRDDMPRHEYEYFLDPKVIKEWQAVVEDSAGGRNFQEVVTWGNTTIEEDLETQLQQLRSVGINEVVIVDLMKPEFGIPVVRAIIPGLEGLDSSPDYLLGRRAQEKMARVA